MKIREILNIMESVENQDSTAEKGLSALANILANASQLSKSMVNTTDIKQTQSATTAIDEGKFSNGLVSLAIAGLSAFGAGGAQAQQELTNELAFCAGAFTRQSLEMGQFAKDNNKQDLAKTAATMRSYGDALRKISGESSEAKIYFNSGLKVHNDKISQQQVEQHIQGCLGKLHKLAGQRTGMK